MRTITINRVLFSIFVLLLSTTAFAQKFNELGKTPQMGWNSWNAFSTNINEKLVKDIADSFVNLGLKDVGYEYIVLDDGWMAMQRDAQGNFVANPDKFPSGIKALADYVHSKGLKFGLYSCVGDKTCAGYPGSRGHEYQDALKFAEWGVDYLKYDWCFAEQLNAKEAYTTMRDALYAAKRPVYFSLCEWGDNKPWEWAKEVGHSWRTTGDINNCFNGSKDRYGVVQIVNLRDHEKLRKVAGPGHWNDMDMMEIGNGGLTHFEEETHFALWALLSSPLILGNDLRTISQEALNIIKNKDIIAVNQDSLGIQGFKFKTVQDSIEIWTKPLKNNEWAVCFFNRSNSAAELNFGWDGQTIKDNIYNFEISFSNKNVYRMKDLYTHKERGKTNKVLKNKLEKNQSIMLRLYK
jgi:alpha-galactosidase